VRYRTPGRAFVRDFYKGLGPPLLERNLRILGISDIHGNVKAVRGLRDQESNRFDAVAVAGDIGGDAATEIMSILSSFECPVMYVFGNWDHRLPYDSHYGPVCHHVHLRSVECCGWAFSGFSGLPTHWGMNPIATALKHDGTHKCDNSPDSAQYQEKLREASKEALRLNRTRLAEVIQESQVGPSRTIVVTHERLYKTDGDLAGVPLGYHPDSLNPWAWGE
jgi:predicted phosphodiesterase